MASRNGAIILGLVTAVLTFAFAASGAIIDAAATDLTERAAPADRTADRITAFRVDRRKSSYPLRDGQKFDRGVWCAYKKEKVYDKYHDETYFIDKKVCLGTIVE